MLDFWTHQAAPIVDARWRHNLSAGRTAPGDALWRHNLSAGRTAPGGLMVAGGIAALRVEMVPLGWNQYGIGLVRDPLPGADPLDPS